MMKSPEKLTPLLKQYFSIKKQHPDRLLLFRMGDFYELFGDDAVDASSILGIALTSRSHGNSNRLPLAGFPHHTLDRYLIRLLKAGRKVAVCDQVEDPRKAKGIVKREVTEVFTPGSITLEAALDRSQPNYLAAVNPGELTIGLALVDISTGRFMIDEVERDRLSDAVSFHNPSEIILPQTSKGELEKTLRTAAAGAAITSIDDYRFDPSIAFNDLTTHFKTAGLEGFGLGNLGPALGAAGAAFSYIKDLKMGKVGQITRLERLRHELTMDLDQATIRNLELVETPYEGRKNSLLSVIDRTETPGGGRLLRAWVLEPLKDVKSIVERQNACHAVFGSPEVGGKIADALKGMPDLERLASKISMRKAGPRDLIALKEGMLKIALLKDAAVRLKSPLISKTIREIKPAKSLIGLIENSLVDEPPASLADGGIFKKGYSDELDKLTERIDEARQYIHGLQETERYKTGIQSLKVGFNRVFGYYLEITKPHLSKVPGNYIRKQTLVSAERFITEELKTKEELILNAEEKVKSLEFELFDRLLDSVSRSVADIQSSAQAASVMDVLAGFSRLRDEPGYIVPEITSGLEMDILDARHPVMERILPPGKYVPNSVHLDGGQKRMAVITGPNMAGKSTYLRQTGLLVLMSQIGCPIPAASATIGVCDRIFTRVGASDDLLRGRSTFMVEMTEAASILNNATERSLILLDELGRGTSTYDGLAIAWSLVEYLNSARERRARTLFATHYHELIALAEKSEGIFNLQVAVRQWQDTIVFLYKIQPGGCDDSYGVQVARLAGLPSSLLDRAREILTSLESGRSPDGAEGTGRGSFQISLFSPEDNRIREILESAEPDRITPIEALEILSRLKRIAGGEEK